MKFVKNVTKEDKSLISDALKAAGFTVRAKVFPKSIRIVTAGDWSKVADILNAMGYNLFGKAFDKNMIHDINPEHVEVHIHHKM